MLSVDNCAALIELSTLALRVEASHCPDGVARLYGLTKGESESDTTA